MSALGRPLSRRAVRALDLLRPRRLAFFFRKLRLPIKPNDLVVDVGSGGDPHPRADVIVDRSIDRGSHRTVGFRRSAPAVIADINSLPFRDRSFAFAVCAHVLEHVDDPRRAAHELSRVARAGYVETPSDLHEKLFPIGWHRWFVSHVDGRLRFEAKPSPFLDTVIGGYFIPRWTTDRSLMRFVWHHTGDLFVQHLWRDSLEVEVVGRPGEWFSPDEQLQLDTMGDAPSSSEAKRLLYEFVGRIRYPESKSNPPGRAAFRSRGA